MRRAHDRLEHVVDRGAARARGAVRPRRRRGDRDAIERALTDDATRRRARRAGAARRCPGWADVADRVAAVYERLLARPRPPARRRPLVAVVTPLPPAASGVADYSYRLIEALRAHCDVHAFADGCHRVDPALGPPRAPEGVRCSRCGTSSSTNARAAATTAVVYCLGNSEYHAGALAQLRRRSGVVLAHEVRLTDLYALSADEPGAVPGGFAATLAAMYDGAPGGRRRVGPARRRRGRAARRADGRRGRGARRSLRGDVGVRGRPGAPRRPTRRRRPHRRGARSACPTRSRTRRLRATAEPIVVSFGVVNEVKQYALVLEAFPAVLARVPDARLAFVGPCADADRAALTTIAEATRCRRPRDGHGRGRGGGVRVVARPRRGRGAAAAHRERRVVGGGGRLPGRGRRARGDRHRREPRPARRRRSRASDPTCPRARSRP